MNNMAKQMEMFDDGGLMDEGGTVDPVSGNDVPPGSNQEEVRDDIPAQLSEGEFVFPADVVRFIGLEKLMMIRQRAKAGLQRMDDMGQMGNSEEAIMPDDLPFSIEDLDMEDDGLEMAQGGVVHMANGGTYNVPDPNAGVYYNPPQQVTTGVATAPTQAASSNIARSIPMRQQSTSTGQPVMFEDYELPQAPVPVMPQRDDLPPFLGGVTPGVGGVDFTEETYVNDAGQTVTFRRYKDGSLKDMQGNEAVIPEGYIIKSEADKKVTTGPTKVKTATVQDDGDGGDNQDYGRGTSLITGEKIAGYSPEEIKSGVTTAKERFAITGNRGIDVLNLLPVGGTFIKNLAGNIGGSAKDVASGLFGKDPIYSQDMTGDIFGVKGGEKGLPGERFSGKIADARHAYEQVLGSKDKPLRMTGYVGFERGDLDPNSGGFFNSRGVAVDQDGNPVNNSNGTKNFSSFSDWANHMAAAKNSGWWGGELSVQKASTLSPKAASNYRSYVQALNKQYPDDKIEGPKTAVPTSEKSTRKSTTETELGYPVGVTQTAFAKETPAEASARERANAEQAARQEVARARAVEELISLQEEGGDYSTDEATQEAVDDFGYGDDMAAPICLTEDMKVRLNGVIDFVTNVQVGDIVDYTKVTEVLHKHMREGYYVVNGELKITNDHPVLANGSWKRTEDLVLGDYINDVKVASIEYIEQVTPTVYIGTEADRYTVYTEGATYTVHGQYKNALKKAA